MLPDRAQVNILGPMDDDLAPRCRRRFGCRSSLDWTSDPPLRADPRCSCRTACWTSRRRASGCTPARSTSSCCWLVGTALLLFGIAALFMRNQVRAIRRLAARGRGVRHGPRYRPDQAGGRHRGAPGRDRVQPDAGTHPPLPGAADRDAGRRVARPAHAADPAAAGAGDDAAARGAAAGRRRDDRRCRGDGADDRRLPGLRARRGHRAGRAGQPVGGAGGGRRRRAARGRRGGGWTCRRR